MFRSVVRAPSLGSENWDIKSFSLLSALSESDDQTAALALSRSLSRPCYFSRLPRPSELVKRELVFLRHPIKSPAPRLTAVIGRSGKDLVRIHTNMERRAIVASIINEAAAGAEIDVGGYRCGRR